MNFFERRDGELWAEDVRLADIAAAVGTPCYVYSAATLERHYRVFVDAFAPDPVFVAFAVKANSNIAVLATLARLGCGADTVSIGEVARALKAGTPPERIVFSGVGKTKSELVEAVRLGLHQINVESAAELDMLGAVAAELGAKPAIAVRVNPDVGAGGHAKITTGGKDAKFGVGPEEALTLYARACAHPHLAPKGLAVHIGSQIRDLAPLEAAFGVMRGLVEALRRQGRAVERLDLGGGLGVPYFNEPEPPAPAAYAAMVKRATAGLDVALEFEPGRLIAANAGVMLSEVIRIQTRPDRRIVVVDAAMNDLIRPAMYDAFHDVQPLIAPPPGALASPADLVGPICETGDTFARDRVLPPLAPGDRVAFMTAGAYGAVMSSTYNSRALAPEVLVRGDRFEIVRRRVEIDEQLAWERLPDWLR
ncbi:MAG: diaminopimelate decarboxylase [Caulobacterales bacterium]|jgi:diaminopimelate decarboxylase